MNKACARPECGKTVYPMEELKCLDKVWHKQCFKCGSCQMTLNMKNYKGYNRIPYCEAHYPKPTASVVADTPEMKRLAENTQNQSLIRYHEDFEKQKGKKLEIADDPEMNRLMKNTQVASQAAYHNEGDRKEAMERVRPPHEQNNVAPTSPIVSMDQHHRMLLTNGAPPLAGTPNGRPVGTAVPPHLQPQAGGQGSSPYSAKMQTASTLIYSSEKGGHISPQSRPVGSIHDYDPLNGHWGSAARPSSAQKFSQKQPPVQQPYQTAQQQQLQQQQLKQNLQQQHKQNQQQQQRVQPVLPTQQQQQQQQFQQQQQKQNTQQQMRQHPQKQQQSPPVRSPTGSTFRALYDYTAADTDEVSFLEGDLVVNCQSVDSGWMTGTVSRTGKWGMLPANYVQRV